MVLVNYCGFHEITLNSSCKIMESTVFCTSDHYPNQTKYFAVTIDTNFPDHIS